MRGSLSDLMVAALRQRRHGAGRSRAGGRPRSRRPARRGRGGAPASGTASSAGEGLDRGDDPLELPVRASTPGAKLVGIDVEAEFAATELCGALTREPLYGDAGRRPRAPLRAAAGLRPERRPPALERARRRAALPRPQPAPRRRRPDRDDDPQTPRPASRVSTTASSSSPAPSAPARTRWTSTASTSSARSWRASWRASATRPSSARRHAVLGDPGQARRLRARRRWPCATTSRASSPSGA